MKIAIVGSRNWPDVSIVRRYVDCLPADTVVVSGGARGVDLAAEGQARRCGLEVASYRVLQWTDSKGRTDGRFKVERWFFEPGHADPMKHPQPNLFESFSAAALFRNGLIIDEAEVVVAFWDGVSSGTTDALKKARLAGKPPLIERWPEAMVT